MPSHPALSALKKILQGDGAVWLDQEPAIIDVMVWDFTPREIAYMKKITGEADE